jgi:PAS domain S-box-containing protein
MSGAMSHSAEKLGKTGDLHRLIDALPGMVFTCLPQPDWPLEWTNEGCFTVTGYTRDELLSDGGFRLNALISPEDRAKVFGEIERAAEVGDSYVVEYRLQTKSGEIKWVWESGAPRYDDDGVLIAVSGLITDITALKQSESSLKEAQQRLHNIFANTAEGIFQTSTDGTYYNVNPALARIYGYESPEAMIAGLTDIETQLYVDPTRRTQFITLLERRDRVLHFESQVRRRDGAIIWISENARAVRDTRGKLLYYEGTVEDITARKAAQDELATERNMLRTVIDAWPDIIYVKDTEGRYILSNCAHTRNLGMTESREIVGRKPEDFFVPSRAALLSVEDLELMRTGHAIMDREEVRIGANHEQRWFLCAKLPLRDDAGKVTGLVAMSRDITQHKQTTEQLRQSQKMEAIGRLAGGVAHDFNNILTAILGYSEIIASSAAENSHLKHDIEQIHAGGLRAAALTQQLLAFSRKQVTVAKPLDVNRVIHQMEQMLRRLIGENIQFGTRFDEKIGRVNADLHQIEQVIMNLVINARDAIEDAGRIFIETSQIHLEGLSAQQKFDVIPGAYVRIAISDNGMGIPAEIQERIFEPFFTTKDQGKGTGLGLATSYGIVQQSGGHISVESEVKSGTTFNVFLPVVLASAEEKEVAVGPEEVPSGSETVLVVEDDAAVRDLTVSLLRSWGYRVLEAADGMDALDVLEDPEHPPVDLMLTDVVMPRLGGKRLAERVQALSPQTRIVFASGYNEEEMLHQGIAANEIAFLRKPFKSDELARTIRDVLDGTGSSPSF